MNLILGEKQSIDMHDVDKLIYTGMTFNETLRIWPPIVAVNRQISKDIKIDGILLPKNTEISVLYLLIFDLIILIVSLNFH